MRGILAGALFVATATVSAASPPADLTIAFFGDQGLGPDAVAVLELVHDGGADLVVHLGDFDYVACPACWEAQIDSVLGPDFPYFASVGNHDKGSFRVAGGYQDLLEARMVRQGIPWEGDLGIQSTIEYAGITLVLVAPGDFGDGDTVHAPYIRDRLAASTSPWRIVAWHRNQTLMQVGGKDDDTGWGVYEEARRGGAIVATAHEHSYSRTHQMASFELQHVSSTDDVIRLQRDLPSTSADDGRSFAFVSGMGGRSIRGQELAGDWWAAIYTSDQGADPGALFCTFNPGGSRPREAGCWFEDVAGVIPDAFGLRTQVLERRRCGTLGIEVVPLLVGLLRRRLRRA